MRDEQQIKEMARDICRVQPSCNDVCNPAECCTAWKYANRAYDAGYRKPEWISVEDRLPEVLATEKGWGDHKVQKSIRVLCACKQKSGKVLVKEGYYELWDYTDKPYWRIPGSIDSVTHWMPLPAPPTEKEN